MSRTAIPPTQSLDGVITPLTISGHTGFIYDPDAVAANPWLPGNRYCLVTCTYANFVFGSQIVDSWVTIISLDEQLERAWTDAARETIADEIEDCYQQLHGFSTDEFLELLNYPYSWAYEEYDFPVDEEYYFPINPEATVDADPVVTLDEPVQASPKLGSIKHRGRARSINRQIGHGKTLSETSLSEPTGECWKVERRHPDHLFESTTSGTRSTSGATAHRHPGAAKRPLSSPMSLLTGVKTPKSASSSCSIAC